MHSHIIQIYTKPIDADKHLNEQTLELYGTPPIDYCYDLQPEARQAVIASLVEKWLPKGLFSLGEEKDTIIYNGGIEEWTRNEWLPKIRKKAQCLSTHNVFTGTNLFSMQRLLDDALDIGTLFYLTDETYQSYAERSTAFMEFASRLDKGTVLYVGGVIGYHW